MLIAHRSGDRLRWGARSFRSLLAAACQLSDGLWLALWWIRSEMAIEEAISKQLHRIFKYEGYGFEIVAGPPDTSENAPADG